MAGIPIPYTMRADNIITLILLLCFIISVVSMANSWSFVVRQAKALAREPKEGTTVVSETGAEVRFQLYLVVQTALLFAIIIYYYAIEAQGDKMLSPAYEFVGACFLLIFLMTGMRALFYTGVNNLFFDAKRNMQFLRSLLFVTAMEGVAMYPAVLLLVYFDIDSQGIVFYIGFVLVLVKMITIYKCWTIFFGRRGDFLQIFLYFCTLEIVPLSILAGLLALTGNYLTVN